EGERRTIPLRFAAVFRTGFRRFPYANLAQRGFAERSLETIPDRDRDVLHARIEGGEFRAFDVEVAMVECIKDPFAHDTLHLGKLNNQAGAFVGNAANRYLEDIVMPVTMRVAALAEGLQVFGVAEPRRR